MDDPYDSTSLNVASIMDTSFVFDANIGATTAVKALGIFMTHRYVTDANPDARTHA